MSVNCKIHPDSTLNKKDYLEIISNFNSQGKVIDDRGRNLIKSFEVKGKAVNVKSFKIPHLLNQFIYKFFRPSKAKRSYDNAFILLNKKIGSPRPLAYFEFTTFFAFKKSYYFSEQLDYDLTFRELIHVPRYPDYENIVRQFTRFTFSLHEADIFFKDHSPGNTLIIKNKGQYSFYLIDLNRMSFFELDLDTRIKNFSRLTTDEEIIKIMSDEYAKLIHQPFEIVYAKMMEEIQKFRSKYNRRANLKKKFRNKKKSSL
jgi:hypothetical protein